MSYAQAYVKQRAKQERPLTAQELEVLFLGILTELEQTLEGYGDISKFNSRPDLEKNIDKAEDRLEGAWSRALAGEPGSGAAFREALDTYKRTATVFIQAFIYSRGGNNGQEKHKQGRD